MGPSSRRLACGNPNRHSYKPAVGHIFKRSGFKTKLISNKDVLEKENWKKIPLLAEDTVIHTTMLNAKKKRISKGTRSHKSDGRDKGKEKAVATSRDEESAEHAGASAVLDL